MRPASTLARNEIMLYKLKSLASKLVMGAALLGAFAATSSAQLVPQWVKNGWQNPAQAPQYSRNGSAVLVWGKVVTTSNNPGFWAFAVYKESNGAVLCHVRVDGTTSDNPNGSNLTGATLSADGTTVYYATDQGLMYKYIIATGTQTMMPTVAEGKGNGPRLLVISKDGNTLSYAVTDPATGFDKIKVVNLTTSAISGFNFNHVTGSIDFAANGTQLVLGGPSTFDLKGNVIQGVQNQGTNLPIGVSPNGNYMCWPAAYTGGSGYFVDTLYSYFASAFAGGTVGINGAHDSLQLTCYSNDSKLFLTSLLVDASRWGVGEVLTSNFQPAPDNGNIVSAPGGSNFNQVPFICASPSTNELLLGPGDEPTAQRWKFDSTTGLGTLVGTFFEGSAVNFSGPTTVPVTLSNGHPAIAVDEYHPGANLVTIRDALTGAKVGSFNNEGAVSSPDTSEYLVQSGNLVSVYSSATNNRVAFYRSASPLEPGTAKWGGPASIVVAEQGAGSIPVPLADVLTLNNSAGSLTLVNSFPISNLDSDPPPAYALSTDGKVLVLAPGDGTALVYNTSTAAVISTIQPTAGSFGIDDVAISTIGSTYRFGLHELIDSSPLQSNQYRVFSLTGTTVAPVKTLSYNVSGLNVDDADAAATLSPDGTMVIMGSAGTSTVADPRSTGTVRLYQVSNGILLTQWDNQFIPDFTAAGNPVFVFAPDGQTVFWSTNRAIVAAAVPTAANAKVSVVLSPSTTAGGLTSTGTVRLSPTPSVATKVTLSTTSSGITIPASVVIAAGAVSANFTITTVGVDAITTVPITATAGGSVSTSVLTVTPPTKVTMTLSPAAITGANGATGALSLTGLAGPSGIQVMLTSSNPSVLSVPATVTVPYGSSKVTFKATTIDPSVNTPVTVTASTPALSATATATVNRQAIVQTSFDMPSLTGGNAVIATVSLIKASTTDTTVKLVSSRTALVLPSPATIVIPAGQTSVSFDLSTIPVATDTSTVLTATDPAGNKGTATILVQAPVLVASSLSNARIVGGSPATLQILLNGPAATGYKVTIASNNAAVVVPSFTFPAGHAIAEIALTTTKVTTSTPVTLTITQGTTVQTVTLTLLP